MKTLYKMLILAFLPIFLFSILFFILILQLLDIFANLWRYLAHDATLREILSIAFLYLPKCISYSIPAALLFTISFTLGSLYMNNELIAVLGSGISLYSLIVPFIAIGIILSVGGFIFEDRIVIQTLKQKTDLYRNVVNQTVSYSNSNVTVMSSDMQTVYHVDYYNNKRESLTNVTIIIQDQNGRFESRIDADRGEWNGTNWVLYNCSIYREGTESGVITDHIVGIYDSPELAEPPATFRKTTQDIEEMNRRDALDWVNRLKNAGLPYREALTEYYKKFFFALSPLIVAIIASGVGGRFKRNILLMNLLTSLVIFVIYYVSQMISLILAKSGYLSPLTGAGASFIFFFIIGLFLLKMART